MSASEPVLSVSNLSVSFRSGGDWNRVVNGVSLDIAPRETVALVGESGSGKSITALAAMGLTPRENCRVEGSVRLLGREILRLPESRMRRIRGNDMAMIFQEPMTSLNPVMTIGFQIAEALKLHRGLSHGQARAEVLRLLERVRIPAARKRLNEYPHNFSGGMRQRVMIAMALACSPRLLIADEPTTALDVTIQAEILELIAALQAEEDMSVLFITHDMGVVAEIADRTVVMYRGDVVETAPTADIFAHASHPYTRALLSAVPKLGSMRNHARPMPFPIVDPQTGIPAPSVDLPDTRRADGRPLLQVEGLTTRFDIRSGVFGRVSARVHAVENVSFDLRHGETLALVGESGCGKSTTGKSILRLYRQAQGSVKLDDVDILKLPRHRLTEQRRRMQMVFQDPFASLDPRMTVSTAIAEPLVVNRLAASGEARERVAELLREVGLSPDVASRFPHEFSGGQRQRICIARALAVKPELIVADEAVSALDVSVKGQVINLMMELQARLGLSYLFISHDMAVVERISHRVAVMYMGEIVEIGSRAELFSNPQHPYTRRLLEAVPIPDPTRRRVRRGLSTSGIKSPVRTADYRPPARRYRAVATDHLVMEWDEDEQAAWESRAAEA